MKIFSALFQTPVVPSNTVPAKSGSSTGVPIPAASPRTHQTNSSIFPLAQTSPTTPFSSTTHVPLTPLPCRSVSPVTPVTTVIAPAASTFRHSPSPNTPIAYTGSHSPGVLQVSRLIYFIYVHQIFNLI